MKIVAVSMCKDELDILPYTLHMMAQQVDAIVIADNGSTDGTREYLWRIRDSGVLGVPIFVLDDPEVGYYQSEKMTALARVAHDIYDATWVIPFDADEVWTGGSKPIRSILEARRPDEYIVPARLYDHMATGEDDPTEPNPIKRMEWRRPSAAPLNKVAVRWHPALVIEMGNHAASYPDVLVSRSSPLLEIHHYPNRSAEQVLRKTLNGAAAYAATDLPEHFGAHWRQWGQLIEDNGEGVIAEIFYKYYFRQVPTESIKIDGERQSPLYRSPAWRP